eukprot:TRINITY_DN7220_c0_g1_i1.p1 TRINITY_DN7220_c0_g1~~TRINITY_DN7220_c0_g1_i1.p1  ORF type:complete len:246 (+),score=34.51 TRINITY_DN7220_c0_g1_i1:47-784(+)
MMAQRSPKPSAMFKATRLCQFFLEGRCAKGSQCTFAHGREQMRKQPYLYRTALCKEFSQTGQCTNGNTCTFAHSEGELRRSKKKARQSVDHQITPFLVASTEEAIPLTCILPKPGFCPHFDDESDGESRPSFSRQSTDCKSRRSQPDFGKSSSFSSQDTYGSHWPDFNDLDAQHDDSPWSSCCWPTPEACAAGRLSLEGKWGLAHESWWDMEETTELKMVVKNTFIHIEAKSRGSAEERSKSCQF